jgi:subfamily B ATP-binding cassette protein MsbA
MEFLGAVGFAFVLWYSASSVIRGAWTAGSFLTFITAAFSVYSPLRNFSQVNSFLQQALAGAERIFQLLDERPKIVNVPGAKALTGFAREIEFRNVSFTYPTRETPAMKNVNLKIRQGETVAIVGTSGSGKTSLLHLLLRFYDPQAGSIAIDGRDIRNFTLDSLRQNFAIVTQDIFLFNETISYNIAYGRSGASAEEISRAAEQAYADRFISRIPDGYAAVIGERGMRLSGGEKQRISLARAILKDAPVMILDEATSSLDTESEQLIQQALEKILVNKTVIIIAHRLSTVKKADRIIVMENGQIVESGTHNDLLNTPGIYQRLCNLQIL